MKNVNDQYYGMQARVRKQVAAWAKQNGWPPPWNRLAPIMSSLILKRKLRFICEEIDNSIDRLWTCKDGIDNAIKEGNLVAVLLIKDRYDEEMKKLRAYERILEEEAPPKAQSAAGKEKDKDRITPDMIKRAREYPLEDLLNGDLKRGRCACPIHGGKNPISFEVKNNYARCYSCGWHGDAIAFLMDTQGKDFPDAVRSLQ